MMLTPLPGGRATLGDGGRADLMPLAPSQVAIEARKQKGREAALAESATEPKPYGQTSPTSYPYTYWWVVGYNQQAAENAASV